MKCVSYVEMRDIINNLSHSQSKDVYDINSKVIRSTLNVLVTPLTNTLNKCIAENVFPKELKVSRIVPIPKQTYNLESPSAYRPIAIPPYFQKYSK